MAAAHFRAAAAAAIVVVRTSNVELPHSSTYSEDPDCRVDPAGLSDFSVFDAEHRRDAVVLADLLGSRWDGSPLRNRTAFFERYGSFELSVSDLNLAVHGAGGGVRWRVSDVAATLEADGTATESTAPLSGVWFVEPQHALSGALREELVSAGGVPPLLAPITHTGPIFSLGAAGAAGHFNRHDENWFAQLWGKKRWHLLMPEQRLPPESSKMHPCDYPPSLGSVCITRPGDVIFLGANWWHATCNLDEAAGLVYLGAKDHLKPAHMAALDGDVASLKTIDSLDVTDSELPRLAAHSGHVAVLDLLQLRGIDLIDANGTYPPLHRGARAGHAAVVSFLLRAGAPPSLPGGTDGRFVPLHAAATGCSPEPTALLLAARADPLVGDSDGKTAAHIATRPGCLEVVAALSKSDGSSMPDGQGRIPLHFAALDGHKAIVEHLLDLPATVGRDGGCQCPPDADGCEPLHRAALSGHIGVCEALAAHGCGSSVGRGCGPDRAPALAFAAKQGHAGVVSWLLAQRVDAAEADVMGLRPLHYAAKAGHLEVSQELLQQPGVSVAAKTEWGYTPEGFAKAGGHVELAEVLRAARLMAHIEL